MFSLTLTAHPQVCVYTSSEIAELDDIYENKHSRDGKKRKAMKITSIADSGESGS